jgi:UPF0755 protein
MRRRISFLAVIIFVIALFLAFLTVSFCYFSFNKLATSNPDAKFVRVYPNESTHNLIVKLQKTYNLKFTHILTFYLHVMKIGKNIQVGEYSVTPTTTTFGLLYKIIHGDVANHDITFIEGYRFAQIAKLVAKNKFIAHKYTNIPNLMHYLGSNYSSPEGLLYPDTYQVHWPQTDLELYRRSYVKMQKVLAEAWAVRKPGLPYKTPYDALIMASILEKETAMPEERKEIAGVLVLRLRKKMRLQVDPTVSYGLGEPADLRLTKDDLRKTTAYNTYRISGLPPTPIGMPSKTSIIAAMQPNVTGALYYVAKGDGGHFFSKTYAEHLAAIAKYLKRD